jgi:DNA-binding transcriptional MerR regulator
MKFSLKRYTMLEVSKILDMNINTLREWFKLGLISPKKLPSKPRDAKRLDDKNINQVILFIHLLKLGYSRSAAAFFVDQEKEFGNTVVLRNRESTMLILKFKRIKERRLQYGRHDIHP